MQHNREEESWSSIREGNKNAFERLFKTYYQALHGYALSVIKDADEAEEVVQNMFYTIWIKRETVQIHTSIKSYMYRTIHNDCLNRIKHNKVKALYADEYKSSMAGGFADSSKLMDAKELEKKINLAIDNLPEQCGLVFRLSRMQHLKYAEIAEQLEISVKTVENHMGKALKILREQLKDYLPLLLSLLYIN